MHRLAKLRQTLERLFPERRLYVRSGGDVRGFVLSPGRQIAIAGGACAAALWMGVCSAVMLVNLLSLGTASQETLRTKAYYERLIADRQARLTSAVAQLSDSAGDIDELARSVEQRHRALALLLAPLRGVPGAPQAVAPLRAPGADTPVDRVRFVRIDQDRLIAQAETFARSRADRLRLALRLAGLDPAALSRTTEGLGGPLIEGKDPKALAVVLDVDEEFARRVQHAAVTMDDLHTLADAADRTPFAAPVSDASRSSGFGARLDPITRRPAFHPGLDFASAFMTPIFATAPGEVSFTGVRPGYGNTVEIDHGHGFKTRYAHLEGYAVTLGQRVAVGQRIGAMGSTGRSTGPHLHYEVWVDGRPQNPDRFLRAGDYVQQTE